LLTRALDSDFDECPGPPCQPIDRYPLANRAAAACLPSRNPIAARAAACGWGATSEVARTTGALDWQSPNCRPAWCGVRSLQQARRQVVPNSPIP